MRTYDEIEVEKLKHEIHCLRHENEMLRRKIDVLKQGLIQIDLKIKTLI